MDVNLLLTHHQLYIDSKYEKVAGYFCNLAGFDKSKTKERFLLSSWYDGYLYTALLGLKIDQRVSFTIKGKTEKARNWSKTRLEQYKYLMSLILSKNDILNELNLLSYEKIVKHKSIEDILDSAKIICDEYSNGGLKYLSELYEKNNFIFDDYDSLKVIMKNVGIEESDNVILHTSINDGQRRLMTLIESGESPTTEFKSTLRVNLFTSKADPKIEHSCLKTIAGFLNTGGGNLLIGVSDTKEILGIENDSKSFGDKPDPLDEFQKHLDNLIEKYLGNPVYSLLNISFPELNSKTICHIQVQSNKTAPTYLKNKLKDNTEEFYIRRMASTSQLTTREVIDYMKNHWND